MEIIIIFFFIIPRKFQNIFFMSLLNCESNLNFEVKDTFCLKSTRIYHLIIQEENLCSLSFYFRYTSLRKMHQYALKNKEFPIKSFPKKLCSCFFKKPTNRTAEFLDFFFNFSRKKNLADSTFMNTTSQFINVLGLSSKILDREFLNFDNIIQFDLKNPFLQFQKDSAKSLVNENLFLEIDENEIEFKEIRNAYESSRVFIEDEIKLIFKKEENKIMFLKFLDDRIQNYCDKYNDNPQVSIDEPNFLRLLLSKLKIHIIQNILNEIDTNPESGRIYPLKRDFTIFLLNNPGFKRRYLHYLSESMEAYMSLQENILQEIKNSKKKTKFSKNLNDFLSQLNPQISNWSDFLAMSNLIIKPLIEKFKKFIDKFLMNPVDSPPISILEAIKLYKNFGILINLKKFLSELNDKTHFSLDLKDFQANDEINVLNLLDFISNH